MKKKGFFIVIILLVVVALVGVVAKTRSQEAEIAEQLNLGQKYLDELDYEKAIATYMGILEIEPSNAAVYQGIADAYMLKEDYDNALKYAKEGYEITGDVTLSELQKQVEQLIKEKEAEEEAARLAAQIAEQMDLGQKYLGALDYEKAIATYMGVLKIEPRRVDVYLKMVDAYLLQEDYENALKYAKEGYDITGDTALADKQKQIEQLIEEKRVEEEAARLAAQKAAEEAAKSAKLQFAEANGLLKPVDGRTLIRFSMDASVYFVTMDKYSFNPALILSAEVGSDVRACAYAKVIRVLEEQEIGQAVTFDLGNGYEITYGQLSDLTVSEGDYVEEGQVFAKVAEPTQYYVKDGSNLYLELRLDGFPMDPAPLFR